MKTHIYLSIAAVCVVLFTGCATANPKAYSSTDQPTQLLTKETDGLRVSIDVVLDQQRSHEYFSTDTLGQGIVPVFVRVENLTQTGSILVEKEQFKIVINDDSGGKSPMAGDVDYKSATGGVLSGVGSIAVSSPLIIIGGIMVSTADAVRHNFVDKEFRNQSLAPGRSAQGFVYCQLPDRKQPVHTIKNPRPPSKPPNRSTNGL